MHAFKQKLMKNYRTNKRFMNTKTTLSSNNLIYNKKFNQDY